MPVPRCQVLQPCSLKTDSGGWSERELSACSVLTSRLPLPAPAPQNPVEAAGRSRRGRVGAAVQAWPGPGHAQSLSTLRAPSVVLQASALPHPGVWGVSVTDSRGVPEDLTHIRGFWLQGRPCVCPGACSPTDEPHGDTGSVHVDSTVSGAVSPGSAC